MTNEQFIAKAWNNGSPNNETGAGFGLRIPRDKRDRLFNRGWKSVELIIEKTPVTIPLTSTFWENCHELRNKEIGLWLIRNNLNRWKPRCPPQIRVTHLDGNQFRIDRL